MPTNHNRVTVRGSERSPHHGARVDGPVPNDERFEVTVRIRRKTALQSLADGFHTDKLPMNRRYLTREQYASSHGADSADMAKVEAFARAHNLVVVEKSPARRSIFLSGTAADFARAFGTTIEHYEHDGGTYRGRVGPLTVPAELEGIVEGVFGIDDRPVAKPHFQRRKMTDSIQPRATGESFTPVELATLYNFPDDLDGSGQCIAIIELGGGYRKADIKAYFQKLGSARAKCQNGSGRWRKKPSLQRRECRRRGHARHRSGSRRSAEGIDRSLLRAEHRQRVSRRRHQGDSRHDPQAIGDLDQLGQCGENWTEQAMTSFDQAFQTAGALGVTVCCAAGDNGSADGETDGKAHVDFPASSPFALGCGGTKLTASGNTIANEVVWNEAADSATGGGVSDFFPVPHYQSTAGIPSSANPGSHNGRGVPDVAGDADPATGYVVRVDGEEFVIGGTSAVAPLWAGLIALMNQKLTQPVGFLNPLIYQPLVGKGSFQDISSGSNGAYSAKQGWDACTGWGTPNGAKLLQALGG